MEDYINAYHSGADGSLVINNNSDFDTQDGCISLNKNDALKLADYIYSFFEKESTKITDIVADYAFEQIDKLSEKLRESISLQKQLNYEIEKNVGLITKAD